MGLKHRWKIESYYDRLRQSERAELTIPTAGTWNVALIFPSTYAVGISNLGFQTAHRLIGSTPGFGVERFFYPVGERVDHPPPYYSLETRRPLGDFDVLAFSFSFEGDFDRLPAILGPLGIPCLTKDRTKRHPLLIAGGAGIGANPQALSRVFDILVPGEGETTIPAFLAELAGRGRTLADWPVLPGVWLPAHHPFPATVPPPHDIVAQPAYSHLVSTENLFGGSFLVEIMRGCPRTCAFCFARAHYRPLRWLPAERLFRLLDDRPQITDLGLIAPSLFDHPEIAQIFAELKRRGLRIRNSSVKWEKLSDEILELLAESGMKSLTLAPETGSPALAGTMGKILPLPAFYATIDRVIAHGFTHVKLYFMVGVPGETTENLEETCALIRRLGTATHARSVSLTAAFSGFVSKAKTPWAKEPGVSREELKQRIRYVRSQTRDLPESVKLVFESPGDVVRQQYLAKVGPEFGEELDKEARLCRSAKVGSRQSLVQEDF